MPDESAERERRTRQLEKVLRFTSALRSSDKGDDAYLILDELRPDEGPGGRKLQSVAACRELSLTAAVAEGTGAREGPMDWQDPGPQSDEEDEVRRFVQLWFARDWFFVEMPNTILAPAEAERILRERTGFRFMGTGAPLHYPRATVRAFNPFAKVYLHGDERLAGEELAYIWFDVWGLALESGLRATACTKNGRPRIRRSMLLV